MSEILWTPGDVSLTQMMDFMRYVNEKKGLDLNTYSDLYNWSVSELETFWEEFLQYSSLKLRSSYTSVLDNGEKMPGASWFTGATLNYAENLLAKRDDSLAILFKVEDLKTERITYRELWDRVEKVRSYYNSIGLKKGDRIAAIMPNIPETVICMLAASSLGVIWSSCSPDFGEPSILNRFSQIEPSCLIAADGYFYKGNKNSCVDKINSILEKSPSITQSIIVPFIHNGYQTDRANQISYQSILNNNSPDELTFEALPFDHPLYILYSSGTTGQPKCIVHGAGGTLLQHKKEHMLHGDLRDGDKLFYYTTCGWMMWNWLVSALSVGAAIVLYEGNPFSPSNDSLWKFADEESFTAFGTSAKYIDACHKFGVKVSGKYPLNSLKAIYSTGSPLLDDSFDYIYRDVKKDVMLSSISGGTDIVSCFCLGNPMLPVRRGELQCRGLGMAVEAFDELGTPVRDNQGELVCVKPFPCMPVSFWNDENDEKYKAAYFEEYPNTWRHGDFITIWEHEGVQFWGRSDSTLNPSGVRIGTAEIYQTLDSFNSIQDAVVVGQKHDGDERIVLFVQMKQELSLDVELKRLIKSTIREKCSPRHVPKIIIQVDDIPYTLSGKKVEVTIKRLVNGESVKTQHGLRNPESIEAFRTLSIIKRPAVVKKGN
jgi:acetoacetyl-CoA synthetase